jgi:hypothetical protein
MKPIACVACGIFRQEWGLLPAGLKDRLAPRFLDSILHMRPMALEGELARASVEAGPEPLALCYGECCAAIDSIASGPSRARTPGLNCVEIILGKERYKAARRAGTFFFMPEWAARWKEVLIGGLGLAPGSLARSFFSENARRFVYVDTGVGSPPSGLLSEIGDYVGADIEVIEAGAGGLAESLERALAATERELREP